MKFRNKYFIFRTMFSFVLMLLLISLGAKDSAADETFLELKRKWVGDFDEMIESNYVNLLANHTYFNRCDQVILEFMKNTVEEKPKCVYV